MRMPARLQNRDGGTDGKATDECTLAIRRDRGNSTPGNVIAGNRSRPVRHEGSNRPSRRADVPSAMGYEETSRAPSGTCCIRIRLHRIGCTANPAVCKEVIREHC